LETERIRDEHEVKLEAERKIIEELKRKDEIYTKENA